MKIKLLIFSVLLVVVAPIFALSQPHHSARPQSRPPHPTRAEMEAMSMQYLKLGEFYKILTANYLDTINYSKVVERGIVGMLAELDPHSVYMTARENSESHEELDGSFSGIGIEFNTLNDSILVTGTVAGTPAARAGLLPGDRIVTIDGTNAVGMARSDVPKHIRGPKGSKIALQIFRRGEANLLDFSIIREAIPLHTIDAAYKIDPKTAYIKVNRFGATTEKEFADALAKMGPKIDGLMVDLRGNGGGYLPQALKMAEFFLERGQIIVSTRGNMYPTATYEAERNGKFAKGRLIILVDENSASASEIVAGAVQDWDRGIVIGRPTFGKGLVQREFKLSDGSALRITIAKYLTPTGRAIQRPYEPGHAKDYYREHAERYGDLARDTTGTSSGSIYYTLRSGRAVYGGGGIRPDVMIEADTTGFSQYWSRLMRAGLLVEFTQSWLDTERAKIAIRYSDTDSYMRGFDAAALLPQLSDYAAERGVEPDPEGQKISQKWLTTQLKALIAQRIWDVGAYYRVFNDELDETYARAREIMARWREIDKSDEPDAPVSDELLTKISPEPPPEPK